MDRIVSVSKLRVRSSPGGKIINHLLQGQEVDVLGEDGLWSEIQLSTSFAKPITGWVATRYLVDNPTEEKEEGKLIKRIVIHCSATQEGRNFTAADINRWHTDPVIKGGRGWSRAGYHWVIELNPCRVMPLVPLSENQILSSQEIANGARGYNKTSIHVCYIGGLDKNRRPKNTMTSEQKEQMISLLKILTKRRSINAIVGHNDLNPMKACPSFDVAKFLQQEFDSKFAKKYMKK